MSDTVPTPPLGLVPRLIRDEQRVCEIVEAMDRYATARTAFPEEWINELAGINKRLMRRDNQRAQVAAQEALMQSILRP